MQRRLLLVLYYGERRNGIMVVVLGMSVLSWVSVNLACLSLPAWASCPLACFSSVSIRALRSLPPFYEETPENWKRVGPPLSPATPPTHTRNTRNSKVGYRHSRQCTSDSHSSFARVSRLTTSHHDGTHTGAAFRLRLLTVIIQKPHHSSLRRHPTMTA